jgi:hypothetical protein
MYCLCGAMLWPNFNEVTCGPEPHHAQTQARSPARWPARLPFRLLARPLAG